jgi:hypothetical protein
MNPALANGAAAPRAGAADPKARADKVAPYQNVNFNPN